MWFWFAFTYLHVQYQSGHGKHEMVTNDTATVLNSLKSYDTQDTILINPNAFYKENLCIVYACIYFMNNDALWPISKGLQAVMMN